MRFAVALAASLLCSGCSWLFPTDFPARALIVPGPVYEGMIVTGLIEAREPVFAGAAEDGAELEFHWIDHSQWSLPTVLAVTASTDRLAFELGLPSDLPLAEDAVAQLRMSYAGALVGTLEVHGLEELRRSGGLITVDQLSDVYSRIELSGDAALQVEVVDGGTNRPVRLRATGEIVLGQGVSVSAAGEDPGPGACSGSCVGDGPDDGDGAGHVLEGDDGSGDGEGGASYGTPSLLPLSLDGGSRGGGAGGGGGGGALELSSLSSLTIVGSGATLSADGGEGDGGSGSGGAIWVRAPMATGALELSVSGGDGASHGRLRLDVPAQGFGTRIGTLSDAAEFRGPMFTTDRGSRPPRVLAATADVGSFLVRGSEVGGGEAPPFAASVEQGGDTRPLEVVHVGVGLYRLDVEVAPGRVHRLCLSVGERDLEQEGLFAEGLNCVDIARP